MLFSSKINKNYAWELILFYNVRLYNDGIDFFEFKVNLDYFNGDHSPKFGFFFEILNWTIIEFNIYNVNHYHEEEPSNEEQTVCTDSELIMK